MKISAGAVGKFLSNWYLDRGRSGELEAVRV